MKLEEVLPALREGKKIYRQSDITNRTFYYIGMFDRIKYWLNISNLLAEDWEIEDEKCDCHKMGKNGLACDDTIYSCDKCRVNDET